jgi:hypothetical protein
VIAEPTNTPNNAKTLPDASSAEAWEAKGHL